MQIKPIRNIFATFNVLTLCRFCSASNIEQLLSPTEQCWSNKQAHFLKKEKKNRKKLNINCYNFTQNIIRIDTESVEVYQVTFVSTPFRFISQFYVDLAWNRDILSLRVKCVQNGEGCEWTGEIRHIEVIFLS